MQSFLSSTQWRRPFWLALLIVSSVAFTFGFACGVPLAAFSAAAALTLSMRDGVIVVLGVWLVNQLTGFAFMDFPLDANTIAWGPALAATALLSFFAARAMQLQGIHPAAVFASAFLVSFAVYEAAIYTFSLMLGGIENMTFDVQSRIFAINLAAFIGLFVVHRIGSALNIAPATKVHA